MRSKLTITAIISLFLSIHSYAQFNVTFQVDMCEQIALGNFDPATQAVFVTGGTANQTGNFATCGLAMTDADMDGVYDITQSYPDGYQVIYKFFIGAPGDAGTDNCDGTSGGYEPNLPAPCGFGSFSDRTYIVNGDDSTLPIVCFGACDACTTCDCDLILGQGTTSCDNFTSGEDTYTASFSFSQTTAPGAGTYTVTSGGGTVGGDDPNTMASGVITITGLAEGIGTALSVVDGAGCDLFQPLGPPACLPSFDVTFQVDMCEAISTGTFDPATQAVFVTGGNANQTGFYGDCGAAMTDGNGDGVYEVSQSYPDGYQVIYKFYIGIPGSAGTGACDGNDASVPGYEPDLTAPCAFGNFNDRTFTVAGADATLDVACFGSCDACTACTCDLILTPGTVSCNDFTNGTDTYDATFNFSQTTAPGLGTYTVTTGSGGTITGDDPNTMASGTIVITGINEGVGPNLFIQDGADCDLFADLGAPPCLPTFDVTFQVNMCEEIAAGAFDPATQAVYVTGGNANQTGFYGDCGAAMTDANGDGIYEVSQSYPDTYQVIYKFYIGTPGNAGTNACDGNDASVPGYEAPLVPCGIGQFGDREYVVSGADATLDVACFNSCEACTTCGPAVPTVSQWGMIILILLLLSIGVVYARQTQASIVTTNGFNLPLGQGLRMPFERHLYFRALLWTGAIACIAAISSLLIYGEITLVDIVGSILAAPIFTYLMHVLMIDEANKK